MGHWPLLVELGVRVGGFIALAAVSQKVPLGCARINITAFLVIYSQIMIAIVSEGLNYQVFPPQCNLLQTCLVQAVRSGGEAGERGKSIGPSLYRRRVWVFFVFSALPPLEYKAGLLFGSSLPRCKIPL